MNPSFTSRFNDLRKSLPSSCKLLITSGHRTKKENDRVGGVKDSYHLSGRAYDVVTRCRTLTIKKALFLGLSVIIYKTHLHIDNRKDQICLVNRNKKNYPCKQ